MMSLLICPSIRKPKSIEARSMSPEPFSSTPGVEKRSFSMSPMPSSKSTASERSVMGVVVGKPAIGGILLTRATALQINP